MIEEQKTKYSYLDSFKIIKKLGAGYHAQVQLGMDDDGNLYAIKRYKKQTANLATLQHELNVMKALNHENLVHLIDVRENAIYKRQDQTTFSCFAIILQYVGGGQLFDFIAETGKFSQQVTRTYFHQMMNGLNYMHSKGYAHRDIKPENILLSRNFVLKLADFGFSQLLKGKDGSGFLHTKLGTEGYMAPQIQTRNYIGAKTDIFAAGVILFIMYAGNPPFERASINDPYYKLIKDKNYQIFWTAHSRRRPIGYFSNQFRDLFVKMVAFNPDERPSMMQIAQNPWVNKDICTKSQITQQFEIRFKKLNKILQVRKKQQQQQRSQRIGTSNQIRSRDDIGLQFCPFIQLYEMQQQKERKLAPLQQQTPDDIIIDEGIAYAVTVLQDFFKNKKIPIQDQNEIIGQEVLSLNPSKLIDNGNQLIFEYQLTDDIEGIKFTQRLSVKMTLGQSKNDKLTINLQKINGNRLYFKKFAKQIKNLFLYCLA